MLRANIRSICTNFFSDKTKLFLMGSTFIVFIASVEFFSCALLALGYAISGIPVILAFASLFVFLWLATKEVSSEIRITLVRNIMITFFIVLIISTFVSGYYFDLSYDGQGYQQEAIIRLSSGWNPYYDHQDNGIHGIWINHYAKGPWYVADSMYKLVGHIEHAKVFNLLYIYAAFLLTLSVLLSLFKSKPEKAFLFALLFAANPVAVNQVLSFYSDGQLASLLTIMVALSYLIIKRTTKSNLFLYALVVILALNIKFTAVLYVLILILGLIAGLLACRQKEAAAKLYVIATISFAVGLALVGFNPYITNTTQQGHPFYPLMGPKAINIIDSNMPADFIGKNRVEKLLKSLFAESSNAYTPAKSSWKVPFVIHLDELKAFGLSDVRLAGFGPLFGAVTILSFFLAVSFLYFTVYKKKAIREGLAVAAFLLVILVSGLANPEVWWARYAPQVWIIPLIVLVTAFYYKQYFDYQEQIRKICITVTVLIAANSAITTSSYLFHQNATNKTLKQQLRVLSESPSPVLVDFNSYTSNRIRFKEVGIKYKEVDDLPDIPNMTLIESETKAIIPD